MGSGLRGSIVGARLYLGSLLCSRVCLGVSICGSFPNQQGFCA